MRDREIGLVVEREGEFVTVELFQSEACDSCAAKVLCKASDSGKRVIKAKSEVDVNIGDSVEIEQIGLNILKVSSIQYGIPLILFLSTVVFIYSLLSGELSEGLPELVAFLSGVAIVIVAGFLIRILFRKISNKNLPMFKVVRVVQKIQEKGDEK